ncbi:MAG: tRNA (adenosine(37)-N6)-threonylcarbamoyltransferase complex dimerization subunit type 1 TsaB [Prevotella sp.]|nr:tRNA (adenosine(37)-N6)-threonylcarbamoyltransferase complex dimerization subunit type 1 TsaB [Prevotella sp.]
MATILHIETSTKVCSVALSQDGACLTEEVDMTGPNHAAVLGGFVREVLSFADSHALPLDAVAVSCGPGSYTGLRIGVSMAKGLCYGRGLKLISVPTLEIMCVPLLLREEVEEGALLCPMLDARRMEVYTAVYDRALRVVKPTSAEILDASSFDSLTEKGKVYFFGDGSSKFHSLISGTGRENAQFVDGVTPLARNMMPLAERRFLQEQTEDVAYFEPFYLKEFVAGKK